MNWRPISEEQIWDELNASWDRMTIPQRHFWEAIRIDPRKWQQHPYGDEGGGFWVVAIMGNTVVWYNDIEEGFNWSKCSLCGEIGEYWCNQDELAWVVQHLIDEAQTGQPSGGHAGPPEPLT